MKIQRPPIGRAERDRGKHRHLWTVVLASIAGGAAVLAVLIVAGLFFALHSSAAHNYLLRFAEQKASDELGIPVHLENFAVDLGGLSLDLYGLTIESPRMGGAEPHLYPPLLQVDHIGGSVAVVSILRGRWYLNNIRVDHPVAQIFTDARGISNLPKPKPGGNGNINVFELGVRHAALDRGVLYYNNKKTLLAAKLEDLDFRSSFDTSEQKYRGALSYRDGDLRMGGFRPIAHALDAQFEATSGSFHLTRAQLSSGGSRFTLTAMLDDYSQPRIQAHYDAVIDLGETGGILHQPDLPRGMVHSSGSVSYVDDPKRPALRTLAVAGELTSPQLDLRSVQFHTQVDDVAARYSLADGNARVEDFRARLLGGKLAATMSMQDLGGASRTKLNAALRGVSLAALERAAIVPAPAGIGKVRLRGVLNADADAEWGKSPEDLVAHTKAAIDAGLAKQVKEAGNAGTPPGVIPVDGVIQGTYRAVNQQIDLERSYLRTAQNLLTVNGVLGRRSSMDVQFKSGDLREIDTISGLFRAPASGGPVQPLGLAGSASFAGMVRGSVSAPHLTGLLTASNLKVKGTAWRLVRTNVDVSPSFASLKNADVEPAGRGRITLNASTELSKWSFTDTSPLQIELHASQLNVADLAKLADLGTPVSGSLNADVRAHGTALNPTGQGTVSLTRGEAYGEPIESAALAFQGTGDEVQGNLAVHLPAGTLDGVASVQTKLRSYTLKLTANQIHLDRLHALSARNLETQAVLKLNASGQGSFDNPELEATVEIPHLVFEQQALTETVFKMNVGNHVATASVNSQGINTSLEGQAKVALTGDYPAQAALDTGTIPLQPLLAAYAGAEAAGVSGETEAHATLSGPLKNPKLLEIHIAIPTLKLAYNNTIQLASAGAIHLDYKNGVASLDRAAIRGTDTNLELQASIPLASSSKTGKAPMSLLLQGTVNLKLASLFSPGLNSSGELRFNINSYGRRTDPNVQGQMQIVNANFSNPDLPLGFENGNGTLTLTQNRLNIDNFKATVGGGSLSLEGGVIYRPTMQFDLGATANGIRMLYPQGIRESVSANLKLAGTTGNALLGGSVDVRDLSFTPAFDLTSFMGQFTGATAPPSTGGFSQNLHLNLSASSTNSLNLVSRTLSLDGTANLKVQGTAAEPVILGRINVSGGDIIFNGDRFVLNGGTIEFVNPAETQPVVNLALSTTIQQYNLTLRFNGPVDQMRTNYTSDPSLPQADIINLLAFGQTTEANSANPALSSTQAAQSLIASQVSSQVTSRISKVAGISQLSINPILAGGSNQGPPGANITIQQRVTGSLFVTFSTNVASTEDQVIMGQYRLSPRVAITVTRDQNGGFAFDTSIRKTW